MIRRRLRPYSLWWPCILMTERQPPSHSAPDDSPGKALAVRAEVLFLVNLMLLPVVAFLGIVYLYVAYYEHAPLLARNHLRQSLMASLVGGGVLVLVTLLIALLGGMHSGYTWVAVVLYFTLVHSSLILVGAIGLSRALVGKPVCYPIIGRWFLREDEQLALQMTR